MITEPKEKNMKKVLLVAALAFLLLPVSVAAATPEESLKSNFPDIKFESFRKSPIEGVYEFVSEGRVIYYSPACECLVLGEIISKTKVNLTQEREMELLAVKMKEVSLNDAIKIGNGKNTVIEFTDADCPYCRAASKFLAAQKDLTRYIFFVSLSGNPQTAAKVKYIFCSPDRAKAYEEVMSGKLDEPLPKPCDSKAAENLYDKHRLIGQEIGIPGTPCFLINGKPVLGANFKEIGKLLDKK